MKKFVLGLICGAGIGAVTCLATAVLVGLRVRAMDADGEINH